MNLPPRGLCDLCWHPIHPDETCPEVIWKWVQRLFATLTPSNPRKGINE